MPAATAAAPLSGPEQLTARLSSSSSGDSSSLLVSLREIKNQIIGNRTKKLVYLRLQAVPRIVALLTFPALSPAVIVQAAAAVGSFACGVEEGVRAVLDAGAVSTLTTLLSHPDAKVVDAAARSLRIIFQSKMAPKYDFLTEKNMAFLLSLLNSSNENVTELAASIISHSCETSSEQISLSDSEVLQKLVSLLGSSINQRDASLDAMSAIVKNNSESASRFVSIGNGKALNSLIALIQDRNPRTRLLASVCLIYIERLNLNLNLFYFKEAQIKSKLILILLELIEEGGKVGDEAPFVLRDLIGESEEIQREALDLNCVEKLCGFLSKSGLEAKRLEGILLVLAELGSQLEQGRSQLIQFKVPNLIIDILKHDSMQVRVAACFCIKNISRSLKNLCAGRFSTDSVVIPLIQLLCDSSSSVQIAALGAICNMAVNLTSKKSVLLKCGAVPVLTQLARSDNSELRFKSLCALRNLMFLLDRKDKDSVFQQLGLSTLTTLISDTDCLLQEQALALASNFVDGCGDSTQLLFSDDYSILNAVSRQLQSTNSPRVCIQGMIFLTNIAAGSDSHKDAVLNSIMFPSNKESKNMITGFLRSKERQLRLATLWCLVNLVHTDHQKTRVRSLIYAGVVDQLSVMKDDDPCLDCKLRVGMVLDQCRERE
ncbi:hypothetical protein LUZ60_004302 [Juncus effusus]|nr:hypothetical protein LUZ60_004302 [Juncus effusus]